MLLLLAKRFQIFKNKLKINWKINKNTKIIIVATPPQDLQLLVQQEQADIALDHQVERDQ